MTQFFAMVAVLFHAVAFVLVSFLFHRPSVQTFVPIFRFSGPRSSVLDCPCQRPQLDGNTWSVSCPFCPRPALPSTNAPTTAPIAVPARPRIESAATSPRCDPNYSGACVPVASDVDGAGGSGNGPLCRGEVGAQRAGIPLPVGLELCYRR